MQNDMFRIVVCKYCGSPEYYGEMRWLSGKCCCRECYKAQYEKESGKKYRWHDLDGQVPTIEEYWKQEGEG